MTVDSTFPTGQGPSRSGAAPDRTPGPPAPAQQQAAPPATVPAPPRAAPQDGDVARAGTGGVATLTGARRRTDRPTLPGEPPRAAVRRAPHPSLALVGADLLGAATGFALLPPGARPWWLFCALLGGVLALNIRTGTLYRPGLDPSVLDEAPALIARTALAWGVAGALLAAARPGAALGLGALATVWAAHSLMSCAGRGAVHLRRRLRRLAAPVPALVLGDARAHGVAGALLRQDRPVLRPVGVVGPEAAGPGPLPVLSSAEEVRRALVQNDVRLALLVGEPQAAHVRLLRAAGCALWQLDARGPGHGPAGGGEQLAGYPVRRLPAGPRRAGAGKRALDLVLAAPALLALSPLLLACALAVRCCDGPGVLFRQERVGQYGRTFTLLKFRTLRPANAQEAATRWNVARDRRMSSVGHFLRRSSLDELPQLWNVLRGDMSLVGPRPERPFFVGEFSRTYEGYRHRHRAPVGITGHAQVSGLRGDTSIEDRCRYDNHYIDHWSLGQDARILLRTVLSLVRPSGS